MADDNAVTSTDDRLPEATGDTPHVPGGAIPTTSPEPDSGEHAGREQETAFGLSRGDVRFAAICGGLILLLLMIHWGRQAWFGPKLVEIDRLSAKAYEFRLDINSATWVEWMQLEGIGEMLARRIVADRAANGPFTAIDDVQRVPGIGPKTLESIRPHLSCSDCPSSDDAP